jgi:hypothetical protein
MYICKCGKEFDKQSSLNSHARFCKLYEKVEIAKSKYLISENFYMCECGKTFNKCQSLNAHFSHCLIHRNGKPETREHVRHHHMCGWENKTTDEIAEFKKKAGKQLSNNISCGKTVPSFLGKSHSNETREKMSEHAKSFNNGFVKCKYFDVFSSYQNMKIRVQGTYEKLYAEYLNKVGVNWVRDKRINMKYKNGSTDYMHTYYPDFYLPDSDEYIEIKGFWAYNNKNGRIDDKLKMLLVIEQNPDKCIRIIEKNELFKLISIT